jgi:hypothetical protein
MRWSDALSSREDAPSEDRAAYRAFLRSRIITRIAVHCGWSAHELRLPVFYEVTEASGILRQGEYRIDGYRLMARSCLIDGEVVWCGVL